MPRPQQRPARNRRTVNTATPALTPDIAFTVTGNSGSAIDLTLATNPTGLSLNGIPQIVRNSDGALPIAAWLTGTTLMLNYVAANSAVDTITVPLHDPAVRNALGGSLLAGEYNAPGDYVAPSATTLSANGTLGPIGTTYDGVGDATLDVASGPVNGLSFTVRNASLAGVVMITVPVGGPLGPVAPGVTAVVVCKEGAWLIVLLP